MKIEPTKTKRLPLLCWDIYSQHYFKNLEKLEKEKDIKTVNSFAKKEKWNNSKINTLFKNQDFDALVITNREQKIVWVNKGFTKMTGYSKQFAVNRTPRFLQGKNTPQAIKKEIRAKLGKNKTFTGTVINYKKDKSLYSCEIKIIPLISNKKVTHYLALEKEVSEN